MAQGHLQVGTSVLCFVAAAAVITRLKAEPKVARCFISEANLTNQLIKRQINGGEVHSCVIKPRAAHLPHHCIVQLVDPKFCVSFNAAPHALKQML